jgi:hypothetical protein
MFNIKVTMLRHLILLSLAVVLVFVGCNKDPEPIPDFLQCTIDGSAWSATKSIPGEMNSGTIIVNGINATNDTLRILIQDHAVGTWPIKNIQNITIYKAEGKTFIPLNSADGFLTIKAHDTVNKLIEGSFYLTVDAGGGDWKVITGGSFKTVYQ